MKTITEELYGKIKKVSESVRRDLYKKGLVVPVKNSDGTITIGSYTIIKEDDGSFAILDFTDETILKGINLPQTAILVTNKLALGLYKDTELLESDRRYGSADFEEQLYKRALKRKSNDIVSLYITKYDDARIKKNEYKRTIIRSFEKLIKLV
jgi:hypothetical protein